MTIGIKILLVDDDEELRQCIGKLLENSGYLVTQVGNGDIGEFMTLLSDFNLVISDINMPEVDGIAMTKFIKSRASTPIILMTGIAGADVKERAKDAHADAFLAKPFSGDELLAAIKRICCKPR